MSLEALFAMAFVAAALTGVLYAWFHKFVTGRRDKYGKGPGHELRRNEGYTHYDRYYNNK